MQLRRSQRVKAAPAQRGPSFLSRLLHPNAGPTIQTRPAKKTSSPLFGRKKKSHTPILGSSNNNPVIGSNSNSITGRKKNGPLFGRKKRTGPAAIINPNQSVRRESVGQKINRLISGRPKQTTADKILNRPAGGRKRRQLF
jgi:hypothetical protein